jgi:ubiquinone/menaquinone biosynthesis C-methylase UbiE
VAREGFGRGADAYDRARPGWPREAIAAAFERFGLDPGGAAVVDLAAGTGRLTRELLALGASVTAVEPVDEMRARIAGATAVSGTAEDIPLPDASQDAVFVGEAFHWFDAGRAVPELARVLRPRGGVAIMWNVGQPQEDQSWRPEVAELVQPIYFHPQGRRVPAASGNDWRRQTEWQRHPAWRRFEPFEHHPFEHVQRWTVDDYLDFMTSWSFVGALADEERTRFLASVRAVLDRHGVTEFDQRWRTDLYLTRRR